MRCHIKIRRNTGPITVSIAYSESDSINSAGWEVGERKHRLKNQAEMSEIQICHFFEQFVLGIFFFFFTRAFLKTSHELVLLYAVLFPVYLDRQKEAVHSVSIDSREQTYH